MENEDQWCFAWFAGEPASEGLFKAVLLNRAKWQSGDKITISFLDGAPELREKVKAVAQTWTGREMANVQFVFQRDTDSMIRVSFREKGSWSAIGATCMSRKDVTRPTMNFGWLKSDSSDDKVRRAVLHEFGHALGLIHEHQHPDHPIDWNRDAVIKDLSTGSNSWSLAEIEENMFGAYQRKETNFTSFDPESIMLYPIPKSWTRNRFSVGLNAKLSNNDKDFIRQQYP